jgi:hypothetical protein
MAMLVMGLAALLSAWALLDGATPAALTLLAGVFLIMGRSLWERESSLAALMDAITESVDDAVELSGSVRDPQSPGGPTETGEPPRLAHTDPVLSTEPPLEPERLRPTA